MDANQIVDEALAGFGQSQSPSGITADSIVNEALAGYGGEPTEKPGDFVAGVKAGYNETAGLTRAAAAAVQSAAGFEDAARSSMANAALDFEEANRYNQDHLNSPFDIRTDEGVLPFASDAVDFMQYQVGKQLPNIALVGASALTGGVGAAALLGREGTKQTLLKVGEHEISKGVAAQIAGGYAASAALETGGIQQELTDSGHNAPGVALVGGSIAGALEFLPIYNLARMVGIGPAFRGRFIEKLSTSPLLVKALGFGGMQALTESGTEALQEIVASTARQVVDEHYDMLGPEGRKRILEAAIVGGVVGLPFGAAGSVFVRRKQQVDINELASDLAAEIGGNKGELPPGMPTFDTYNRMANEVKGPSQDLYIAQLFERYGRPSDLSDNIRDAHSPAKTRLPTITVVGENGLATGDVQGINERNAYAEHLAELSAREVPPERRTPSQAALVRIKDHERANAIAEMMANPRILVGPITTERAESGLIIPGGVNDTRTDQVSLVAAPASRARPRPPSTTLMVPGDMGAARLQTPDELNTESLRGGGEILIKAGSVYENWKKEQAIGAAVETTKPTLPTIDTDVLDLDTRFGNGVDRTKLTTIEQKQLQQLEEKEMTGGLSAREYERLSFLLDKSQGVDFNLPDAGPQALQQEVDNAFRATPISDPTQAILDLLGDETSDPYASRVAGDYTFSTTPVDVKATLEKVALPYGPNITVVPHAGLLPNGPIRAAGAKPGTRALFVPDTGSVYMIANRHADAHSIVAAYFHEVIGHYGLRQMLSAAEYKKFVDLVYRSIPAERIRAIAKLYDLSTTNPLDRAEIAEEAFAIFAEANPQARLVDRVVAIVRDFIRRIFPNLKFNDNELRAIVTDIRRHLSAPINTNNLALKFPGLTYASRMVDADGTPKYTTRVLDALPKKDWLNVDHVAQALKATGAKASEYEVFREVLALPHMGRQFLASDLRAEVMKRIANLEPNVVQLYGDYGLDRLGYVDRETEMRLNMIRDLHYEIGAAANFAATKSGDRIIGSWADIAETMNSVEFFYDDNPQMLKLVSEVKTLARVPVSDAAAKEMGKRLEHIYDIVSSELSAMTYEASQAMGKAASIVWEAPFKTEVELIPETRKHYPTPYYMGHTRIFLRGDALHVSEIQSDLFQVLSEKQLRLEADLQSSIEISPAIARMAEQFPEQFTMPTSRVAEIMQQARLARTIYSQMIREVIRYAANAGQTKVRFSSAETAAQIQGKAFYNEGVDIENPAGAGDVKGPLTEWAPVWAHYAKEFPKIYKEFDAKPYTDEKGWTWYEIDTTKEKGLPVKVFASKVEQGAAALGVDKETQASLGKFKSVLGAKAASMFLTPLQIAKVYSIEPIKEYIAHVQNWWTTKTKLIEEFDRVAVDLAGNKERANALSRAVFEASTESDRVGRRLNPATEVMPILQKYGVDKFERGVELFWQMDASFRKLLDRMERGLKYNAVVETLEDPNAARDFMAKWDNLSYADKVKLAGQAAANTGDKTFQLIPRIQKIEEDINKLRNRNYFPRKRFGQYGIGIRATKDMEAFGEKFKKGELILFETHETRSAQLQRVGELKEIGDIKGEAFELGKLSDQEFQFLGMPPTLMETVRRDLQLTPAQKERLKEIEIAFSPGRAFLRHLLRRKGTKGYSEDMIRVYAAYGMSAANHIARMEHHLDMGAALQKIKDFEGPIAENVKDNTAVNTLFNYFTKHYDYILNPENDWAKLRALGFMWYLGFNVKSALVNSTQIPLTLYPYLAERFGDGRATREIAKALKDAVTIFRLQPGQSSPKISNTLNAMLERGKQEGFIDESLATELAGFTESSVLERLLPVSDSGKLASNVSYYGAWMFRQAEKYSRTVAFIAAARLAEKSGVTDLEQIFQVGKEAVQTTMFEYSKWNRPQFMRGKKSVVFLFWNWMQHASFLAAGGAGRGTAVRFWVMLLLAGGLQGLPFAEDILDILDTAGTKIREMLGLKETHLDTRKSLLEFAKEDLGQFLGILQEQPDLLTHGLGRYYGLGPLSTLTALGAPIPYVDISGSVSMGRYIPGVEELLANERDPDAKFGRTVAAALGPVAGIPYNLWKTYESSDPDIWKKWERAMPVAVKSLSKATRLGARGEETFRGGGTVVPYDIHDMETRVALLSQAFGFTSTKLSQKYELMGIKDDMRRYYSLRRQMLMEDYAYAIENTNREAIADARRAVYEFNNGLPDGAGALRISQRILSDSIKQRKRRARLRTMGLPNEKGLRAPFQQVDQLIPSATSPPSN